MIRKKGFRDHFRTFSKVLLLFQSQRLRSLFGLSVVVMRSDDVFVWTVFVPLTAARALPLALDTIGLAAKCIGFSSIQH